MLRRDGPLPLPLPFLVAVIALVHCSSLIVPCHATQAQPLQGQGFPPPAPTDVYVSAMLERLLNIDETNYHFTSLQFLYLSWRDPRALGSMEAATEAYRNGSLAVCKKPCTSSVSLLPRDEGQQQQQEGGNANTTQQYASAPEYSCCDNVWLPAITFMNSVGTPTVERYAIDINTIEDKDGVQIVYWVEILGVG